MTQELIERLEPCPFCGSTDVTMYASNGVTQGDPLAGGSRSVECNDCGATGPAEPSPRIGTAWNTRDQSQSARIPELREALKPFAAAYENEGDGDTFEDRHNLWEHPAALELTVGDLRRASLTKDSTSG